MDSPSRIRVLVRTRPLLSNEPGNAAEFVSKGLPLALTKYSTQVSSRTGLVEKVPKVYSYPHFTQFCDASAPTEDLVNPKIVEHVVSGHPACTFAFGFTGTGKSFSIFGSEKTKTGGLASLISSQLLSKLKILEEVPGNTNPRLRVSMFEIYGKVIKNLFDPEKVEVTLRSSGKRVFLRNKGGGAPTRLEISEEGDLLNALSIGLTARNVGSSTIHDESSRSHAILEMEVITDEIIALEDALLEAETVLTTVSNERDDFLRAKSAQTLAEIGMDAFLKDEELQEELKRIGEAYEDLSSSVDDARDALASHLQMGHPLLRGRLVFCDLAGADWEKGSDVQTKIARSEMASINQSLLAVKECIIKCGKSPKPGHIPFRNSSLTRILQPYMEDDQSFLDLIATISPSDDQRLISQSISTLNYAQLILK